MRENRMSLLFFGVFMTLGSSGCDSSAPALEPTKWLNTKEPISWESLQGRLILVEKWATW